ncbi:MAG: phage tail protein [Elusimicrobia bacterium]|nr:phage tail protein [Elusimicrobiota bacterium]
MDKNRVEDNKISRILAVLILFAITPGVFAGSYNSISVQGQLTSSAPIYGVKVDILSGTQTVTATDIALIPNVSGFFSTQTYISDPKIFLTGADYIIRLSSPNLTVISSFPIAGVPFALTVRGDVQNGDQNVFGAYGNVGIGTTAPAAKLDVSGTLNISVPSTGSIFAATGGSITYSGSYTIHTFTSSGTFTPNVSGNIQVIIVAGGGGGGYSGAGGGGAGGVVTSTSFAVTAQPYAVTVGGGGSGGPNAYTAGSNGGDSIFSTLDAVGGGGGGSSGNNSNSCKGVLGGSGGGGGNYLVRCDYGAGTTNQGYHGGYGDGSAPYEGGGGGGAGAVGANYTAGVGGVGGIGVPNPITGSVSGDLEGGTYYFAGGGGGSGTFYVSNSIGGAGGYGGDYTGSGGETAGTANTGGGGGAGGTNTAGLSGGSGIVIITYLTSTTVTNVLRTTTGGYVGIGTTVPTYKLDIASGIINVAGTGAGITTTGNISANAYYGNGSTLSSIPLLGSTQTFTGKNTFSGIASGVGLWNPGDFKWKISQSSACGSGWLRADGTSISTITYSSLFSELGYMFGGSGANFSLPDMNNGKFIRAIGTLNPSMGIKQSDTFQTHVHSGGRVSFLNSGIPAGANDTTSTSGNTGAPATGSTGSETRPRNYAMIPCIYTGVK